MAGVSGTITTPMS